MWQKTSHSSFQETPEFHLGWFLHKKGPLTWTSNQLGVSFVSFPLNSTVQELKGPGCGTPRWTSCPFQLPSKENPSGRNSTLKGPIWMNRWYWWSQYSDLQKLVRIFTIINNPYCKVREKCRCKINNQHELPDWNNVPKYLSESHVCTNWDHFHGIPPLLFRQIVVYESGSILSTTLPWRRQKFEGLCWQFMTGCCVLGDIGIRQ